MEVVAGRPYQHDVQEWQHLDRLTGVLHQGRTEAGSWTTDQQQYGKVIDTQSLVGDGLRGLRTRQLEVYTTRSPGQQLQVVRTTSSTSTSTHWRSQQHTPPQTTPNTDFDDLQVSVNRLDLTSQRNKANIGRSGSLSSRRPPSRVPSNRPSILERQNGDGKEHHDSLNDIDNWRTSFGQKTSTSDSNRRLSTALRNTSVDLDALDQILKNISSDKDDTKKKNSFVTAESLQEVRGRLRRLSSEKEDKKEDITSSLDDGIEIPTSKVRSYVYGMEMLKKPIIGTGSLESRTSNKTNLTNRSEDWYNRRKSYGFEQVHNQNDVLRKNKIESSTDSGICRSSEIVVVPQILKEENKFKKNSTVINLNTVNNTKDNELFNVWNRRSIISQEDNSKKDVEQIKITIPIVDENKRHSIAVDETKYHRRNVDENDDNLKKHKKVEFCKTEVHFAADSGRVNIVETDEKPPPTQNFRRRRRNSLTLPPEDKGLPLIHFGDYEKKLFGIPDENELYNSEPNVTVSSVHINNFKEQENNEIENPPRGILKNKLTKPKPYILGDDNNELINEENFWGVKLRPVIKEEPPLMWKSTVTVQNTSYIDNEPSKTEFQKLLHNLKPASRQDGEKSPEKCTETRFDEKLDFRQETFAEKPLRRFEEKLDRPTENVDKPVPVRRFEERATENVEIQRPTWSVADRVKQVEEKQEVKGYSTKINFNSGEATIVETKEPKEEPLVKALVVRVGKEASHHTVCKTSNNTTTTKITIDMSSEPYTPIKLPRASLHSLKSTYLIMNTFKDKPKIPDQLEELKKLYEQDSDDSLDEEVRSYMSNHEESDLKTTEDEISSVVSGSWSKMKAFRNIQQHLNNIKDTDRHKEKEMFNNILNRTCKKDSLITSRYDKTVSQEAKVTSVSVRLTDKSSNSSLDSPQFTRKPLGQKKLSHLSSPSLVGSSIQKSRKPEPVIEKSAFSKVTRKESPQLQKKPLVRKVENGRKVETSRKDSSRKIVNKPDLLQFNDNREYANVNKTEPIYENIDEVITNLQQMEKESVMLQELTKAADQILQAVNGYTDEDSKDSDDTHRLKLKKNLSTISETKSWKQQSQTKVSTKLRKPKTSSTSSIESLREVKPVPPVRLNRAVKLNEAKKKSVSTAEASKVRARRLQRASSREALLHSHSSSEDISQEVRKPRMVRRTRATEEVKKTSTRRTQSEREGIQEIRHKTAVSTIRSTAEKKALKAREEVKKRSAVRGAAGARDQPKSTLTKRYVKEVVTKY